MSSARSVDGPFQGCVQVVIEFDADFDSDNSTVDIFLSLHVCFPWTRL